MTDLKGRISGHFGGREPRTIEVPEWGEGGVPLVVHYTRANLKELGEARQLGGDNLALGNVRLVTMKAKDAEGRPLFKMADATFLMEQADPGVIGRLAAAITGDLPSEAAIGAAEGN